MEKNVKIRNLRCARGLEKEWNFFVLDLVGMRVKMTTCFLGLDFLIQMVKIAT